MFESQYYLVLATSVLIYILVITSIGLAGLDVG